MDKSKWGVHESHCCTLHGCKYGDKDCPVYTEQTKQDYTCEQCSYEGFKNVSQIEEYLEIKKTLEIAKSSGIKNISVSVEFLDRMLNHEPEFW